MSAIFGLFHTDQSPVDDRQAIAMQQALLDWGPHGQKTLVSRNIALGHQLFINTPEGRFEALPCESERGVLLTAAARLDNRDELCDLLGIAHGERPQTPDSALILRAYEKWGERCPERLLGDWSFAIFEPRAQKLFVARDHLGNTGLYYAQDGNRFVFASSRAALLAVDVPRRLNELFLAQLLIAWPAFHGAHTIDLDIFRLPPAHAMTVTPEQRRVWQYWRLADTPEMRLSSFEETVEGLLELYDRAVRSRLRSSGAVGVTLSGGLDSGSAAALAARALGEERRRLAAYTSAPPHDVSNTIGKNRFGDERTLARATATHWPNVDHTFIRGQALTPIAATAITTAITQEPVYASSNFYWILELLRTARHQGVTTMLTGQGGNATISWTGKPELSSPWQMKRRHGWKELGKRLLPVPLLRLAKQLNSLRQDWGYSAIDPAFARRLKLGWKQASALGKDVSLVDAARSARQWRLGVLQPDTNMVGSMWAEVGAAHQVEIRDPTLDQRVVTYTFAVPERMFVAEDGLDRWLIRSAMSGLLPDEVRLNRRRGQQAADLVFRLQESAGEVEQALARLQQPPAADYLNLELMRQVWAGAQREATVHTTHRAATILMRGISAGLFLNDLY